MRAIHLFKAQSDHDTIQNRSDRIEQDRIA
jgi:hypothetical protein